ncbi:nitrogenase iron-molybdenum cofactor biosynthesis protein NifN [Desulfosporosinus nitroreducens]|uniref:Nitrogenase iron-molybdenum cofactor biosynthesis protein NifN n=1 Tax=Desulfosporosinus nitroreducens TaxID=2018668 RepID=A0ABT8QKR2_9FIRM|nr:nitrogenase iron-molybdenum cofactor biosynthesis protein NifN [Desulfosporosinus nitroreducens]MCO1600872.1 nitrogenase iron-molybdenum cofactor biosynthesis protein NifN [Desulfosporosinus nitroreducens]MDO0821907.1 nitrogenase iron-molybdenum cofactor biosynthesis protein NifN [Desulfosporosinus nitroreducens]
MTKLRHYNGNPQKNSPALGATLAFLGVNGLLALLHGSQGCSSFIRLQLSRHYKEPIPLNSTALLEESVIFGGWDHLKKGIAVAADKYKPQIIGVMSSGLTETYGDDMVSALASLRLERPDLEDLPVVLASTPDYIGSMQEGYQRTVEALLMTLAGQTNKTKSLGLADSNDAPSVALLPGCHLTPGDVDELKEIVKSFGYRVITVPDLSISLDGHAELEAAPVVQGGTLIEEFQRLPECKACFSFGQSMEKAGEFLKKTYQIPHFNIPSLTGLTATDTFILTLAKISGKTIPERLLRQRSRLLDTLADYHDQLGGQKIAIALEMDLLYSLGSCLVEVGSEISVALSASQGSGNTLSLPFPVEVGDLEMLEERAADCDLIIANSNGRQAAGMLKVPHLRAGLPVFDRAGYPQKRWIGYEGTQQFLFDMLNSLS